MSKNSPKPHLQGCIIEVDTIVLNGMQKLYQTVREALVPSGITLDEGLFTRYLQGEPLETGLVKLAQAVGGKAKGELATALQAAYVEALQEDVVAADHPVVALVRGLTARGVQVGLLTKLPAAAAEVVLEPLLECVGVRRFSSGSSPLAGAFSREVWARVREKMELVDRLCVAIVASGASHKAALAAGLAVVAIPDKLTGYQDYSGAYDCFDSLEEPVLAALLQALRLDEWRPAGQAR